MTDEQFQLRESPEPVGWWVLPGGDHGWRTTFATMAKPNALHRLMNRLLLGWVWEPRVKGPV